MPRTACWAKNCAKQLVNSFFRIAIFPRVCYSVCGTVISANSSRCPRQPQTRITQTAYLLQYSMSIRKAFQLVYGLQRLPHSRPCTMAVHQFRKSRDARASATQAQSKGGEKADDYSSTVALLHSHLKQANDEVIQAYEEQAEAWELLEQARSIVP